jgi:hypothetical protein
LADRGEAVTRDDHSASRRVDVLQREAPHLVAPPRLRLVPADPEERLAEFRARRDAARQARQQERRANLLFVLLLLAAVAVYLLGLVALVRVLT